ncbi:PilZ domain-containing protein [Alteromonas sediminis]|nr:PilZ domain-containing protein [Alteromonas sediminis]
MSDPGFSDRRASARLDMEQEVISLSWTDENNQRHEHSVVCSDVSRGGLKLLLPEPLQVDSIVDVQLTPDNVSAKAFNATVVRCIQRQTNEFEIGLQFIQK